jgi:hypothetical protein
MSTPIKPGNELFTFVEKFTLSQRAAIEISNECPSNYASVIAQCINRGWIKPVAYVSDEEYLLLKLSN